MYLSEGRIAIGTDEYTIEIWDVLDSNDFFKPSCIYKMYGQSATSIVFDNIFYMQEEEMEH